MKKIILMLGLVLGMSSFASELYAQPPQAKAWGKRGKNWNKGEGRDEWQHREWNRKHVKYRKVKKVQPAVIYRDRYNRPVRRGVAVNARARF